MLKLYVNNYRGFSDTIISFKDVNFFVGENSTGKTSILILLQLIYYEWRYQSHDFNSENIQLGSYDDIVTSNNTSFEIGFTSTIGEQYTILSFVNKNGNPIINRMAVFNKSNIIIAYKKDGNIYLSPSNPHSKLSFEKFIELCSKEYENAFEYKPIGDKYLFDIDSGNDNDIYRAIFFSDYNKDLRPIRFNSLLNVSWIGPIRIKPKEIYLSYQLKKYHSPEGEHTLNKLKDIYLKSNSSSNSNYKEAIELFGKMSGLYNSIKPKKLGKSDSDASPFEIYVNLKNKSNFKLPFVGYGISQILPIITEQICNNDHRTLFLIQQPEVHLHPKAQAAYGDFLYNVASNKRNIYFIETHSDFIIDRFRLATKKNEGANKLKSQVLFFEKTSKGNKVTSIEIMDDGKYSENQPPNFKDFFLNESISMLELL